MNMTELIFDRSPADTAALEALFEKAKAGTLTEEEKTVLASPAHKGAYNYTDLNRVNSAMAYLVQELEGRGYIVHGYRADSTVWSQNSLPNRQQMRQYLDNVAAIRAALAVLPSTPAVPGDMEALTAAEANAIEKVLADVESIINAMQRVSLRSGYMVYSAFGLYFSKLDVITPPRLPDGYIRLDYIESSGTQYIDTLFIPDSNTKVVMDAQMIGFNSEEDSQAFYGVRTNNREGWYALYYNTAGKRYTLGYGSLPINYVTDFITDRVIVTADKNVATIGDRVRIERKAEEFTAAYNLHLFAMKQPSKVFIESVMRLYSCQIYDDGVLVRDYVPCVNESGEVGLYDLVSKAFYGNAGTGEFVAGYLEPISENALMSADGYVLTDVNGVYLIPKEDE